MRELRALEPRPSRRRAARSGAAASRGSGATRRQLRMRRAVEVDEQRREHADEDRELELDGERREERHARARSGSPRLVRAIRRISRDVDRAPTRRRTGAPPSRRAAGRRRAARRRAAIDEQEHAPRTRRRAASRAGFVVEPLRLNEPDDGYAGANAPTMLDRPWPMNSWLPSMRWPDLTPTARAIDTASVSPSTVSASAAGTSVRQIVGSNDGQRQRRQPAGSAPTVGTGAHAARRERVGEDAAGDHRDDHVRNARQQAPRGDRDDERHRAGRGDPRVERCRACARTSRRVSKKPRAGGNRRRRRSSGAAPR